MKTAIEQLIDELEQAKEAALNQSKLSRLNKDDSSGADGMVVGYMSAIKKASEMLPIEKQQMEKMFTAGAANAAKLRVSDNKLTLPVFEFEEYYKNTFDK